LEIAYLSPDVEGWEKLLRAIFASLLVLLYLSNVYTGWCAAVAVSEVNKKKNRYLPSAFRAVIDFALVPSKARYWSLPAEKQSNVKRLLLFYIPYFSSLVAVFMVLSHTMWLKSGAWLHQEHIYSFIISHYFAAICLHLVHTRSTMEAREGLRSDS
jgi:putative effector of murein hydrolase LrgA (UPF0299 family)